MGNKRKAVILGAGPLGLITAWKLLENGWEVDIYERDKQVGGTCKTWRWREFLIDTGPHIYHTPDEKLAKFWDDEFGDLFVKGDFWCKNVKGEAFNEYWDYPLSWESIARYPKKLKEQVLGELDRLTLEDKARAKSYNEYMDAQVGKTLREMFFEHYPEKIWGIKTLDMTPDWAPKRIEFRQKVTPFYHKQWNAVGKYGTGCIFERIKEKIEKLGGKIYLNYEIVGLDYDETKIKAIKFANGKTIKVKPDDTLISSVPITFLSKLLGYASALQFRILRTVYLAYNKPSILPKDIHWFYYDSSKVYFHRVTEAKKLTEFVAPKDKTYLTAEITCSVGDEIYNLDAKQLIGQVAGQIELVGLAKKAELVAADTHREDAVYPIQTLGYQQELAKTRAVISKYQQLYSLGTGGEFHYSDIQIIFHKAFDLVANLCGKDSSFAQTVRQTKRCHLNHEVTIGDKKIGLGHRAYIIAEGGLNHNGSVALAKKLIDEAKAAGCDAIKFQTFKASSRISQKVKAVKYAETIIGMEETLYEMFDRLAMSPADQKEVFAYARQQKIEIFSTPFDVESVDFLEKLGVNVYKIASMDMVNLPLIEYVAKTQKPIILSTGMSTLAQIEDAVETVRRAGNPNLILLHCNSSYPAALEEMNLNVMQTLEKAFGVPVGLSDHTFGLFVSQVALSIGAKCIERHFTLDRTMEGPDHILSSDPKEMAELVKLAQMVPKALGDGIKAIQPNEYDTLNMQRKSLYAAASMKKGTVITKDMIAIKGPGGGILPKFLDIVVGKKLQKDIEADYPITWEVI